MNDTTSQKYMPMGVRVLAIITAGAFLFTSLGAAPAEASFWEERAAARNRQVQGSSAPVLLAQLPASQPIVFGSALQPALPSVSPKLSALTGTAPLWAQQAVTPFADVRSVREGGAGSLRVFLVMDAHDVYSAQRNVARLLAHLGAQGKMVVGVEGTSGAFDLERHRGLLPGVGQIQLVDHLLKKGFLNGAEAYGLTAERAPVLWGVEDEKLYDANVRAYRGTLGIEGETRAALDALKRETLARQAQVFSEQLQALDREVQAQHEGRGDMGRYVRAVVEGEGEGRPGSQVRRFMEAKAKEDRLSFPAVEQARAAFIERVSPRLSPYELDSLVRETAAFRAGSMSAKEYYRGLVSLALSKGVPVAAYPAFQSYIDYVSLADGIDAAALMDELDVLEARAYARLAQGESLKLVEWSIDLRLADRAVQHALTPREWDRYEERRGELARLADRAAALGIARAPAEKLQANLPRFAAFFEAAAARNNALLDNAVAEAHRRGAAAVALVTGGFHSPALEKLLIEKNISHMVLTPRIDEVPDSAAGYLGAFAPTRTPLERLLLGDRLFMNPPSATSVAVENAENSFHPTAVALSRADMAYGAVLARGLGKLEEFVSRWNERFNRAKAQVEGNVVEFQFAGNEQTVLLVAAGGGASGESLIQAVEKEGGTVVETGKIGDQSYVLGGKNLTRFFPELMGGAAFLAWLGGSALAPPAVVVAVGFVSGAILGGFTLRGILLAAAYWHGLGHALLARMLGGQSVRASLREYSKNLPWTHLVPGSRYFLPGVSPSEEAPRFEPTGLRAGWRTSLTGLAGPAMNLMALALLLPVALAADPGSAQQWVLGIAAGVNLWMAVTSISDFKTALSGIGDALYCGNLGVLGKRRPEHKGLLPKDVDAILARMWKQIIVRGGQSGGRSVLGKKGFVRSRLLNLRRAKLDQALRTSFKGEIVRRRATGSRPIDNFIEEIDHARFATGGPSKMKNAHPFVWGLVEGLWNAFSPRKARVWTVVEGGVLKNFKTVAQQIISHNGDFDAWIRQKGEAPIPNDGILAGWLTRALGRGDPSAGDSPKIAGMLELLLTQGQWGASFRLAYAMDVADSIEDVMKQSVVRRIGRSADKVFESWLNDAHAAGCRTLQDVFNHNAGNVGELREQLLNATRMDTQGLSQEKKDLLVDRAIHYFFFNDLQEAGRFFSDRADGTFGMVMGSSLFPGEIVFGTFKQPMYVGVNPETESLVYASELSSVKAAGKPGKNQVTELLPYIYFMENGEVAHFKIGEGDIPNSVAFSRGFEFLGTSGIPDLSGSEMGGRHSLTVENLERWASQAEAEGGRGWIGTRDNKNLSGGVSVAESDDLVLDTLNDVPKVLATINADWAGQNPDSPNLGAAEDFAGAVLERARVRSLARYSGDGAYKNQIDVLVLGAEYGLYSGEHFATDLNEVFPGLKVEAVDSKAFAVDPERYAIGPDTIVLAVSHSGQYFHTVDDVAFLNALHEQGRCGPVFGMAGLIDSVPLGQALGQSYKASAKSNRRLFVTHAGWRLDEPKPVVPLATEMTLSHLLVKIAEKAGNKKFGRSVDDDAIRRLKEGQDYLQERSESIFGINRKGQRIDVQEHKDLAAVGHRYSQRLTEFLIAMPVAALHLFVVLYLGGNPIQGGFDLLYSLSQWGVFSNATTVGHFIVAYWQVPYFIMAYFVAAFGVRLVQRRPLWGRYVSAPTLFLGDTRFVHQTMEVYLRKLFSLSYGWAGWGEFKTGDTRASFIDEVNPSIKRGDVMFKGLPLETGVRAMAQMTSTQLRGSLSLNSTAEAFALGHQAPAAGKFDGHSVLAGEDAGRLAQIRVADSDGGSMSLLESRVFSIERLMAFDVIFHENAARTRDWTNRFVLVLRWVAWPLFFLARVISFGKFEVPLFPWDIAETQGRANIFTTQVGKPISVSVKEFSPRAFLINGRPAAPRAAPVARKARAAARSEIERPVAESSEEAPGKNLPTAPEAQPIRPARVNRTTLLALASDLGMTHFSPSDSLNAVRKGIWDYLNDSSNHSVRISGQHEAALFSVLSFQGAETNSVQIHLGSQHEGEPIPLKDYLRQWTSRPVPEFLDVTHNGGVHVTLVPPSAEPVERGQAPIVQATEKSSEAPSAYEADFAGFSALARFLGVSTGPGDTENYLKNQIRSVLSHNDDTIIPSDFEAPLIETMKGAREAYRSKVWVTNEWETYPMNLFEFSNQRKAVGGIPAWAAFWVTHNDDVLDLAEASLGEMNKAKKTHVNDTGVRGEERPDPKEALLDLAVFLNIEVDEQESSSLVAKMIEEQLTSVSGETEVPGQYVEGLIAMLSMAQNRSESPILSFFNDGAPTSFPVGLNEFLSHREYAQYNWMKYYVTFKNSGGVKTFSIFQNSQAEDGGESVKREDPSEESSAGGVEEPTLSGSADQSPAREEKAQLLEETIADTSSAVPPATDWSFARFVANIVSKSVRALTVIIVCILLTSWGHTFISSVEKVSSEFFGRPQAHEITSGNKGFANRGGIALDGAPRAFVNTKSTGLMAFDRSPAEKNPVIGRVVVRDSVKVMERKGAWVLVESSGKQGWIKGSSVRDLQAGRAEVVRNDTLRKLAPPLRSANLPKGAALAVIGYQGKWAHVAVLDQPNRPAVWVSQEYISAAPAGKEKSPEKPPFRRGHADLSLPLEIAPTQVAGILASLGSPVPVLGQLAKRAGTALVNRTSSGAVLHERLLAGSLREFEPGPKRVAAEELASFVDRGAPEVNPIEKQLVLAMGYGIVAGESWAQGGAPKDRPLYDDYRRTREIINGGKLSPGAGRALTRLARRASGWKENSTPTFAPGALPVINLSEAGQDSALLGEWAVAVARTAQGEPTPVIVARNQQQQRHLLAALDGWRREHAEVALTDEAIGRSQWVYLDSLEAGVVVRDGEGNPQTVWLGALLNTVHVDVGRLPGGIDVVTGAGTALTWDRSDVPASIAVRLIVGFLNNLSLTAPLAEAQGALRSARKTLTAA